MKKTTLTYPDIPGWLIDKWQNITNLLAQIAKSPAALILIVEDDCLKTISASQTENNPFRRGSQAKIHGLYCEEVITSQQKLNVPNAFKSKNWSKKIDLNLGMISYLGFPIKFPDNSPFGTICVLDTQESYFSEDLEQLMMLFRDDIQNDLTSLFNSENKILEILERASELGGKELIAAKEKAVKYEEKFRTLFKEGPIPTYIWKHVKDDFVLQDYNNAAFEYTKGNVANIVGIKAKDFFHTNEQAMIDFNECLQTKSSITREMDYQFKTLPDKKHLKVNYAFVPPDQVLLHTEDFTERKKAENALIESEAKYKNLIEIATDPIYLLSENGTFIDTNERACKMLGWSKDEIIGSTIDKIDPVFVVDDFLAFWEKAGLNEQKVFESEHLRKDGTLIPVEINSMKFKKNGKTEYYAIVRDITKSKQAALELKKAKEKAEESDRLKSAFLANMSHEIRTPMNGILGFLSLLEDTDLNESEKSDFMKIINKSGIRLLHTINDIIEISKIESGDLKIRLSEVNIAELMQFHLEFFKLQAKDKGIELRIKEQVVGDEAKISTDKDKLDGILTNLIGNAIKYTSQGKIEFGNYMEKNQMYFYVTDTGNGIPENKLANIFDRFNRADLSRIGGIEGSGIGLSIVKAHIEALNGTINVNSEIGKGSTFMFSLPCLNDKTSSC